MKKNCSDSVATWLCRFWMGVPIVLAALAIIYQLVAVMGWWAINPA